ncbi:MAG: intradiol ring-cleavage dioxygenase [Sphingosinicella sp.]
MTSIDRRNLLLGAGALGLLSLPISACGQPRPPARSTRLIAGDTCPVTPRQTEGPFYFDPRLVRRDITERRPGVPLRLQLQIVGADACAPLSGTRVDVWHCDAGGIYSGYEREGSSGETFLRGTQLADADGVVNFRTLYPGWYQGRAPHIHLKAILGDGRELISQLYFPDDLSQQIYGEGAYAGRPGTAVRNGDDGIFRRLRGAAPMAAMTRAGPGYEGRIVIALA